MINPYHNAGAGAPVTETLRLVLKVSQGLGVAPVRFQETQCRVRVSVCHGIFIVHIIFMSVLNIMALCGYVIDATTPSERSERMRTPVMRIAWTIDVTSTLLIASFAAYSSKRRLKIILKCLQRCQKMKFTLGVETETNSEEQRKIVMVITGIFIVLLLVVSDYYLLLADCMDNNRNLAVPILFSSYEFSFAMAILLEMQFVFTAFEIHYVLRSMNKLLKKIGRSGKGLAPTGQLSKRVPEAIQQLAATYDEVYTQVLKLGGANSTALVMLLGMFILRMVITSYNLITSVGRNANMWTCVLLFWCFVHLLGLLIMVEPPHLMKEEMERTNYLICCLENKFTDPEVSIELAKFSLYVALNKVSYSPAGVCKLSRSLLYSILGLLATYIVVILQFKSFKSSLL